MQNLRRTGCSWLARRTLRRAFVGAAWLVGLGGPFAAGCSSSTTGKAGLATGCTVTSDCDAPLVCTFGLCHTACKTSVDCTGGARCVKSGSSGVCQLAVESLCTYNSDCTPLICAVDQKCREQCKTNLDCVPGQICAQKACADKGEVNATGQLTGGGADGGPGAGTGGAGGNGGTTHPGSGGSDTKGEGDASPPGSGGFPNQTGTGGVDNRFTGGQGGQIGPRCGVVGQPCCGAPGPSGTCTAVGATCLTNGMCVSCGALSEQCCANDTCTNATSACSNGSCVSCGAITQPCCGSTCNATLACISGTCDVACTAPYVAHAGVCIAPPPRPTGPLSGSNVNTRLPKLSWALPAGFTTAHVDVCKDRACTNVLFTSDVTGTSVVVGTPLPPGLVFWRLLANDGGTLGTVSSAVWEMQVGGPHDAPKTAAWGAVPDFNGDGFADAVMQVGSSSSATTRIYSGSAAGLSTSFVTVSRGGGGGGPSLSFPVGDIDGDGFVDLVVPNPGGFDIYKGSSSGISAAAAQSITGVAGGPGKGSYVIGDVNGDGYGDLLLPTQVNDGQGNNFLGMSVYTGGPSGVYINPQSFTTNIIDQTSRTSSDTCDFNGDGYTDVIVSAGSGGSSTGTAVVFYGGAAGISNSPTPITVSGTTGPGFVVSCAGDVNGDGYDDAVMLSSSASIYHGSSTGLATNPSATLTGSLWNSFSTFTLGLGDVNGDGYSDIIVPGATAPALNVYLGSSSGLTAGSTVALQPPPPASFVVSNANVEALSALGDVTGDGFADFGFEIDWTSTAQIQNHQTYLYTGAGAVSTAPTSTLPMVVSAIR
jgi:hypothetical protein